MTSSEHSPLLLPTNMNDHTNIELNGISPSLQEKASKQKEKMMATFTMAAIMFMAVVFVMTGSTHAIEPPSQEDEMDNQVNIEYAEQYPQDAANAKLLWDQEKSRASVDSFVEAFARGTTQSFHTNLFKGSRDKLRNLLYLNTTSAYSDLVTDGKSSASDFYEYVQGGWDAQINQGYCGVAAIAAVLNSLKGKIELPQDPIYKYVISLPQVV